MIKSLRIKNFQSHKESDLNFSENVNSIIGSSDNGKTSIIRALNWIINNKPNGNSFIRNGEDFCSVNVVLENDVIIMKYKDDKKKNYYQICDEEKLEAFGQSVPEEIIDQFNFTEINLQNQFDQPFLIMNSPGEVANVLNKVINLEVIGASLSDIESRRRDINRKIEFLREGISSLKEELISYDWLEIFEKKLSPLQEKQKKLLNSVDMVHHIVNIIEQVEKTNSKLVPISKCLEKENTIKSIEVFNNELSSKINKRNSLLKIIDQINDIINKLSMFENLEKIKESIVNLEKKYNGFCLDLEREQIISNALLVSNKINSCDLVIHDYQKRLNEIMPDICPLCGNEIKEK